jgi:hypothetical protein
MRIHCDGCGRALDSTQAVERSWDGEVFQFCSESCARAGRHLADDPYGEDEGSGGGPLPPGDLDEPLPKDRPRGS